MDKKQLSIIVGAVMGLSIAAPGSVLAAGMDYEGSSQDGMQQDSQMGSERESANSLMQMQVSELKNKPLISADGNNLGEISDIVQKKDDQSLHAVVAVGGILGVGQNRVTLPVEDLHARGDEIVTSDKLTQEELDQRTAYNADDYDSVSDTERLAEVSGVSPGVEIASFEEIDEDGNGVISQEEAQTYDQLAQNWQQYDLDSNQQLDQSEFSAFESDMKPEDTGVNGAMGEDEMGAQAPDQKPEQTASFSDLDVDGDGIISQDEAQQNDQLAQNWQQYDFDSNQELDRAEFSVFESEQQPQQFGMQQQDQLASFDEVDENGDGYISRDEAQKHENIVNAWQDVDVNSDDQLDESEFSAFEAGWEAAGTGNQMKPDTGIDSGMGEDTGMSEEPGSMNQE